MPGSTLTTSTTSIPATRGRPLAFTLDLTRVDDGSPFDLAAVEAEALLAWSDQRFSGVVDTTRQPWVVSWGADATVNLPQSPTPSVLVTLTEEDGTIHDILIPVATHVVPLPRGEYSE